MTCKMQKWKCQVFMNSSIYKNHDYIVKNQIDSIGPNILRLSPQCFQNKTT